MSDGSTTYSVRLPTGRTVRRTLPYDMGPTALAVVEHLGGAAWLLRSLCKQKPKWLKTSASVKLVPATRVTTRTA
jgi:hypothetical protein